jgi:replicative superfamily II helicase
VIGGNPDLSRDFAIVRLLLATSDILQMVGRAGRPQFDTEGVAVILTHESSVAKYRSISSGLATIESTLHHKIPEHLNSEIVLGTITDISQSIFWCVWVGGWVGGIDEYAVFDAH